MSTTRSLRAVSNDISARPLEWNPPRQAISRVPYLPGLDGMRALAVVAVMIYHTNNGWLPGGFIGVEVFFVISGYLITLLLIGEHEKHGRIDLKQFWLRRARRLLPALFFMMTLLMIYTAIFKRDTLGLLRGDVIAGLGYITNWYQIWVGAGYTASADFAPLRHLWSLAVEEQFYLAWPLVMVGLIRLGRRRLPDISRWLLLAALVIAVVMAVLYPTSVIGTPDTHPDAYWSVGGRSISRMDTLYLSTITRSTGLLIGAAFAMLWRPVAVMRGPLRNKGRELDLVALAGLAALGALAYFLHVIKDDGHADAFLFRGGFLAVGLATVMVMAAVTHKGAIAGPLLGNPVLNWIGTRSYGLYLFHWPIYQIIRETAGAKLTVAEFVGAMAGTAVITEFSYRFIEMPIRKQQIGRWWEKVQQTSDPKPRQLIVGGAVAIASIFGFAAVSMATAPLKQNDVRQALDANQDAVTDLGAQTQTTASVLAAGTTVAPTAVPPTTGGAGASPSSVATTSAPSTSVAAPAVTTAVSTGPIDRLAVGDSVMLGAAHSLDDYGFVVDAHESRQFGDYLPTLKNLADSGRLGSIVVVHLGTNGTIDEEDAEEFFTLLKNVPQVWVLTLAVDRSWTEGNNELLLSLPSRFPNVHVGYWGDVAANCTGNCFASDGFHLSEDGSDYYAQLIATWAGIA
jgi:peptidoglycan/LPS O-acetylase OafA/YrhL